ncbi:MAG TPA: tripartite tricarboxylate transporter substrate binding protein [Xanthobacteraceae bacterium]|nr:tripartite tricarboxylate transporter substrate binding protein [Xanthobacteraceae bacterium]
MSRILLHAGLALLAAVLTALPAAAQNYPARAVNMIIPFPPGGNTDLMGRALQEELRKALGQPVIVINKGGAAGTIGIIDVIRAQPDGYTLALTPNNPLTAQPHMRKLPYGMDSFRYICLTYYSPYVLIAGPQAPFKTFQEFLAFAKAKPENLVYGHPGPGSQPHLGMLSVLKAIGVQALGVPFQGAGPMSHALLAGTVMAIAETPAVAQASNLTVLAALTEERIPALPDVPTMKELGYAALGFTAGGLIAPKDTPADAAATLEKACAQATATAEYKAIAERLKAEPRYLAGDAFRKLFDEDSARAAQAVKDAGLAAQ